MALKIHPNLSMSCSQSDHSSSEKEVFTVWMKSLVYHGHGCTVFNSNGDLIFRVDNYQTRRSNEVFLMDSAGKVLFSIHRKKCLPILGRWEGFKWIDSKVIDKEKPWFQVRKKHIFSNKDLSCKVTIFGPCDISTRCHWKIVGSKGKSNHKIIDLSDHILAEIKEKQSSSGIRLGDDVMTLIVEPHVNKSLIMALILVYNLINNKV